MASSSLFLLSKNSQRTRAIMSLVQRTTPFDQGILPNRPTILLACLCFLRLYTRWTFDEIGEVLLNNFPELLSSHDNEALVQLLRRLWAYTRVLRPTWLDGMHEFMQQNMAWSLLDILQRQLFRCSCTFPAGWRDRQTGEVDIGPYLCRLLLS